MSIYFGNDTVNDLYIGLTPVTKGYVGTHLFYNGDNTIIDLTYEKYILNTQSSTLYNTAEKPVKSAILKGNTERLPKLNKTLLGEASKIVSVKMPVLMTTGKNIVGNLEKGSIGANGENVNNANDSLYTRTGFILLKKDTSYSFSLNGVKKSYHLYLYDLNKNFKEKIGMKNEYTPEVNCYIRLFQMDNINNALYQVEEGTIATPYEPYQSNILTVNEEVTLRSNGDVYDELNLLTGRLTQRIDENNEVLSQEVVKSVDLTIVNQDGNETNLSTFNDITHVMVSSGGLIPVVELEVATKNEEVLNTMSLEMDNISTTQNTLEETSNAQSENVDATMIATTEIYEQLL